MPIPRGGSVVVAIQFVCLVALLLKGEVDSGVSDGRLGFSVETPVLVVFALDRILVRWTDISVTTTAIN